MLGSVRKQCKLNIRLPNASEMKGGDIAFAGEAVCLVLFAGSTGLFGLKANSQIANTARKIPVLL